MRKLIVLIMTSVLATGAVANADQLNISENPDGYILINGLSNASGPMSDGDTIVPKFMESDYSSAVWGANEALTMSADVYDDGNLDHVAFCFYDSNAIDEEDVDNNCDKLDRNGSDLIEYAVSDGDDRPSALSVFYMEDADNQNFLGNLAPGVNGTPAEGDIWKRADRHYVALEGTGQADSTVTDDTTTLKGEPKSVKKIEVKFALSDLAAKSDGWTFRVLAKYIDGAEVTEVVSTSPESFNVQYVGTVDTGDGTTNRGNPVWNVAAGSSQTKGPTSTGTYRANNTSDVTLEAEGNWSGNSTAYTWGTDSEPTGTDISMSCNAEGQDPVFMGFNNEERFLLGVPSLMDAVPAVTAKYGEDLDMGDHVCTVYVGPDAEAGIYDATMTVGILEEPAV